MFTGSFTIIYLTRVARQGQK